LGVITKDENYEEIHLSILINFLILYLFLQGLSWNLFMLCDIYFTKVTL